jgi:DNA-binding MarR family transcriptional regulator
LSKSKRPAAPQAHDESGRFAYEGLERLLHEKSRLSIMTCLMTQPQGLLFNDVKKQCAMTDGNLNRHLDALFRAGYIEVWKKQESVRSQTLFRVTPVGRKGFLAYLQELERVIHDAMPAKQTNLSAGTLPGWQLGWT